MKKLLIAFTVCLTIGILLSSCVSNMSITKRHYTRGYYIDYTRGKQTTFKSKEEKVFHRKIWMPSYPVQIVREQSIKPGYSGPAVAKLSNEKVNHLATSQQSVNQPGHTDFAINNMSSPEVAYAPLAITSISDEDSHRRGLSLFWLVILVIIILWAIGIIAGGISGLINLLLVVALILLILWLLRIV